MKTIIYSSFAFCLMLLSSCQVVEGIFKAGLYVGIFAVVLIVALIFYIISKFKNRS